MLLRKIVANFEWAVVAGSWAGLSRRAVEEKEKEEGGYISSLYRVSNEWKGLVKLAKEAKNTTDMTMNKLYPPKFRTVSLIGPVQVKVKAIAYL